MPRESSAEVEPWNSKQRHRLDASDAEWEDARRREAVIRPLAARARLSIAEADEAAAALGIRRALLYRLLSKYREKPVASTLLQAKRGPPKGERRLPAEVEALIAEKIRDSFRSRQKPKPHKLLVELAHELEAKGLKPVSAKALRARLGRIDPAVLVRDREGPKAAADKFRPVTHSYNADYALQVVQVDHTLVDLIIVDEVHRLPIQRPWLTLAIDVASRMVAGFHLTLEAPSATSVALALQHAVLPKEPWLRLRGCEAPWPVSGIPDAVHADNGKEFHSKALQRGAAEYGIELQYRPVRTPHYGGHIERLIGTMMGEVHLLPGTTFSNIEERGAYEPERHAVMTLVELEQWLAIQVTGRYHAQIHRALLRPPNAAWGEALAKRPTPLRQPIDPQQFFYDFLPFEPRLVRRDGIQLFNIRYWDNILSLLAGRSDAPLRVKYDPRDLSRVFLEAPDGRHWPIPYRDLGRPPISLWEHREATRELRARGRRELDEQLIFDAIAAQRMIVAEAARRTKAARRRVERSPAALERARLPPDASGAAASPDATPAGKEAPIAPYPVEDWS